MNILVINAGSSSLKYQLFDMDTQLPLAKGVCERIGIDGRFTHKTGDGRVFESAPPMPDHTAAFEQVKTALTTGEGKVIDRLSDIAAIGHRAVHGGTTFSSSARITPKVLEDMKSYTSIAPLHTPAIIAGVEAATAAFGTDMPQCAVFDTAFHQTIPEKAYMYGLPYRYYEQYGIRRYGFHGTSHRFVAARAQELLGKPDGIGTKIITCHLGNGSSIAAIKDGKVIDTTMGFTPLDGFLMGTRTGAFDPSVVTFIMEKENLTPAQMDNILNKESGMLGLSGVGSDDRDVCAAMEAGNPRAQLAWDVRTYQIVKYIGSYIAALGGVDMLVFTAGIGENQFLLRAEIMEAFAYMGLTIDASANTTRGQEVRVSTEDSAVQAWVIPTNEELVIARDTLELTAN